jgi:hypothetical protein
MNDNLESCLIKPEEGCMIKLPWSSPQVTLIESENISGGASHIVENTSGVGGLYAS